MPHQNPETSQSTARLPRIASKEGIGFKSTIYGYGLQSLENLEFYDTFDGTTVDVNRWVQSTSGMSITQTSLAASLNPSNNLTGGSYAILQSVQNFWLTSCIPLHIHLTVSSSLWALPANVLVEFGWMACATTSSPTDGMFIRAQGTGGPSNSGVAGVYAVLNNAGAETSWALGDQKNGVLPPVQPVLQSAFTHDLVLDCYSQEMRVYVDGVRQARIVDPANQPMCTSTNRLPASFRVYNTGVPSSSPNLLVGQITVSQRNANFEEPYGDRLVGMGFSSVQAPAGVQTANAANSAEVALATLSNTAAGYATLGGRYAFAAIAGAVTDYALFAYQVPAGRQLFLDGVSITAQNSALQGGAVGAAVATTPTLLEWFLGLNSSAVSLATADALGPQTWSPRRMALGLQGMPIGSAVGYDAPRIYEPMREVVDAGRYCHAIVKMPIATATANQVIRGTVTFHGRLQ